MLQLEYLKFYRPFSTLDLGNENISNLKICYKNIYN